MTESKAGMWLVKGVVAAMAALLILPFVIGALDLAQAPLRRRWTSCFGDTAPEQAMVQLRLAKTAYARGDFEVATAVAERGQKILEDGSYRRGYGGGLPYVDVVPPIPEIKSRVSINVLGRAVRTYQYHCYPVPRLPYNPFDPFGEWEDGPLSLTPEQQELPRPVP